MNLEMKKWRKSGEKDFDTAKYLFNGKKYEESAFFCQQAVEKLLKAKLLERTNKLIKVHDLVLLARKLDAPENIIIACSKITPAYIDSRYPDLFKEYSVEDLEEILLLTKEVLEWTK